MFQKEEHRFAVLFLLEQGSRFAAQTGRYGGLLNMQEKPAKVFPAYTLFLAIRMTLAVEERGFWNCCFCHNLFFWACGGRNERSGKALLSRSFLLFGRVVQIQDIALVGVDDRGLLPVENPGNLKAVVHMDVAVD